MIYSVTDIAELVEYHLVASAQDDAAHANLVRLVQKLAICWRHGRSGER
jgi:hypothetical protein